MPKRRYIDPTGLNNLQERLVSVNRVAKVIQGGRIFSFSAVVVVGDGEGHVGVGIGKAREVSEAIRKGGEQARKAIVQVPLKDRTIPHEVIADFGASTVLLKPAAPGTGVIAGGPVRAVVESAGIHNILTKCLGSTNAINVVRATIKGLEQLRSAEDVYRRRGLVRRVAAVARGSAVTNESA